MGNRGEKGGEGHSHESQTSKCGKPSLAREHGLGEEGYGAGCVAPGKLGSVTSRITDKTTLHNGTRRLLPLQEPKQENCCTHKVIMDLRLWSTQAITTPILVRSSNSCHSRSRRICTCMTA